MVFFRLVTISWTLWSTWSFVSSIYRTTIENPIISILLRTVFSMANELKNHLYKSPIRLSAKMFLSTELPVALLEVTIKF